MDFLKKYIPSKDNLEQHKLLQIFGKFLHDPNLWHFNRFSISRAAAVGLFCAWIPVPFQMSLAAFGAILCNANLPLSVALVWLTNPVTMPPLFFFSYFIGAKILQLPIRSLNFELSFAWLGSLIGDLWKPFLLGCLICALGSAFSGYIVTKLLWRFLVIKKWRKRIKRRIKII